MATAPTTDPTGPTALPGPAERARDGARAARNGPDDAPGRDDQLIAAIERLDLTPVQRAYMLERWLGQLRYLGRTARTAQRRYYTFRLVAILGGVTIPALIGLSVDDRYAEWIRWATFVLGLLVAAAVALEEFFRFGERWRHFRHQAELLRGEGWSYLAGSGAVYRRAATPEDAFRTFVARCEETLRQEVGVYVTEVVRTTENPRAEGGTAATSRPAAPPKDDGKPGSSSD